MRRPTATCGLEIPGADGTPLATDVCRPAGGGRVPALLARTPYDRKAHLAEGLAWAARGYAYVAQDVRGRYDSPGTWRPYRDETADGLAALAWVRAQPWCDGRVVPVGEGYEGWAALALARDAPGGVAAVAVTMPAPGPGAHGAPRPAPGPVLRGVPLLAAGLWWRATYRQGRTTHPQLADLLTAVDPALLTTLPVTAIAARAAAPLPDWPPAAPDLGEALAALPVPALVVGGWYDPGTQRLLERLRVAGDGASDALVVGPWASPFNQPLQPACDLDFGPAADVAPAALAADWLDAVLAGADPGPRVRLFALGAHHWVTGGGWPPGGAPLVLGTTGDGALTPAAPGPAAARSFAYDPCDPAPALPHSTDHAARAPRPDVLAFATGPLPAPLRCLGAPVVHLLAGTDAPCTDWVARLLHVLPGGRTFPVGQAAVEHRPAAAGARERVSVSLPPVALDLPAGHGLTLEVTSSAFPDYARNLNTGEDRLTATRTRAARQTVLVGDGGTALRLPQPEPCWGPA